MKPLFGGRLCKVYSFFRSVATCHHTRNAPFTSRDTHLPSLRLAQLPSLGQCVRGHAGQVEGGSRPRKPPQIPGRLRTHQVQIQYSPFIQLGRDNARHCGSLRSARNSPPLLRNRRRSPSLCLTITSQTDTPSRGENHDHGFLACEPFQRGFH